MANIIFDVDGTLISKDDELRPETKEVFEALINRGHKVYCWSAGGMDYVKRFLNRHNLNEYITKVLVKGLTISHLPDIIVDDEQYLLNAYEKRGCHCLKVPFYEPKAGSEKDQWMASVLGEVVLWDYEQKKRSIKK